MKAKKQPMLLAAVVLVLTLSVILAGCGTQAATGKTVVLRFTTWRPTDAAAFAKLNAAFEKTHPNIQIKYQPVQPTEYDSQLSTALDTNTAADLMYVRPFDRGYILYQSGHLLQLTDKNVPNLKNIPASQMQVYQSPHGKIYALPYIYISYGFFYNQSIFAKYSLTPPQTWHEFFHVMDVLKKNGVTPLALGTKAGWVIDEIVSGPNYVNFLGGEKWRLAMLQGKKKFTGAGFTHYLQEIDRFRNYMPQGYQGIGYTAAQKLFLAGKAAILPGGSWEIKSLEAQNPNLKLGLFTSPVVKTGGKRWLPFNGGAGVGINTKSAHIKQDLVYVNWLASHQAQVMTGNYMPGLFPSASINPDQLTNPLVKQFITAAGPKGENFAISWPLQYISRKEPSANTLDTDNVSRMLNGQISPGKAAANIQNGLATWYAPFKK
ncbi:MAG: extracellular solute-binding protein [Peptococcaceae bacterium]|jgi:raffinose/stachyose/melibiose transport system substrate-binding protein|nr:extracellular solute-binding protein [Peptococcaceae bacterium]